MNKWIKKIIVTVFLLGLSSVVLSAPINEDPIERKMLDIAAKLRCTVCQNQPVAESNSGLARDMRSAITEKLKQGNDEQEIMQFFVDRYGDYVLLEPPHSGNGMVLWVLPPLLFVFAIFLVVVLMKSRGKKTSATAAPVELSAEDKERIKRARIADTAEQNSSREN